MLFFFKKLNKIIINYFKGKKKGIIVPKNNNNNKGNLKNHKKAFVQFHTNKLKIWIKQIIF